MNWKWVVGERGREMMTGIGRKANASWLGSWLPPSSVPQFKLGVEKSAMA